MDFTALGMTEVIVALIASAGTVAAAWVAVKRTGVGVKNAMKRDVETAMGEVQQNVVTVQAQQTARLVEEVQRMDDMVASLRNVHAECEENLAVEKSARIELERQLSESNMKREHLASRVDLLEERQRLRDRLDDNDRRPDV